MKRLVHGDSPKEREQHPQSGVRLARTVAAPSPVEQILHLQRTVGNGVVLEMLRSPNSAIVQRDLVGSKVGDRVRNISSNETFTVIGEEIGDTGHMLTLKAGIADDPVSVFSDVKTYEPIVETHSGPSVRTIPPPPPPSTTVGRAPVERRTKWEILKDSYHLTDSEVAAMQAYTTSTYVWLNGYLRSGDKLGSDMKGQIIKWLVNTGVIGQVQRADPAFNQVMIELIEAEEQKGTSPDVVWSAATPVLNRILELIVSGMEKWPQPEQQVVTRGVGLKTVPEFVRKMYDKGQIATDPGFMSTTYNQPFSKDSIVVIKLPSVHPGRNIAEISKFEQEAEILFPPGSGFTVDRILSRAEVKDKPEFDFIMKQLVSNEEEREGRFAVVEKIYLGKLVFK